MVDMLFISADRAHVLNIPIILFLGGARMGGLNKAHQNKYYSANQYSIQGQPGNNRAHKERQKSNVRPYFIFYLVLSRH